MALRIDIAYWCCKGGCDHALSAQYRKPGIVDGWEDIPDLAIPAEYLRWIMAILNHFHREDSYSKEAFEALKEFLINLFPLVCRDQTDVERERLGELAMLPEWT
ncbi:MAG: hypothetical protein PSV13_15660 [Lacunisphaera sp.]|nr:hypothetical protein [Lacunisphaera sp.]